MYKNLSFHRKFCDTTFEIEDNNFEFYNQKFSVIRIESVFDEMQKSSNIEYYDI